MVSISSPKQPHAVCIPYPAQGHITPMLKLAKLLHYKGFHITFVNTEFNHNRLLKSRGNNSLDGVSSFRFVTIPDGLPLEEVDATQDTASLCVSMPSFCLDPFKMVLKKLGEDNDVPPVSCVVSDGGMSFTADAAEELGIPEVLFWTTSASCFMALVHIKKLVEKGIIPLKDGVKTSSALRATPISSKFRTGQTAVGPSRRKGPPPMKKSFIQSPRNIRKPNQMINQRPKPYTVNRQGKCHICGEMGHYARECSQRKSGSSGSGSENLIEENLVAMISEVNIAEGSTGWYLDSSVTVHVCNNRQAFKTFEEVVGTEVHMGNSSKAEAKGKGTVELDFTSGKKLTLMNVLYILEIKKKSSLC